MIKRLLKKADNKVLVVCDIQLEFIQFISEQLLNKIESTVNSGQWDEIIVVVDENNGEMNIPNWLSSNADHIIYKSYGGVDPDEIEELLEEGYITDNDGEYRYNGQLLVDTDGQHPNFIVPEEFEEKAKNLTSVTLIGGAVDECLEDVHAALSYLNVKVNIDYNLTYSYSDKQKDTDWTYDYNWVSA